MPRSLIIGYGNVDRSDDGVACTVVNTLRRQQGLAALGDEETGLDNLGAEVDSVFLSQLTIELMETLRDYDRVIFVDAHIGAEIVDLCCGPVKPEGAPSILMHHLSPGSLLALVKAIYGKAPAGQLVSVRGYDFDFHRGLSPATEALAQRAVDWIVRSLAACSEEAAG